MQVDWVNILTAVVAVAGLIFSIYNFYASRKDKKPQVEVKVQVGTVSRVNPIPNTFVVEAINVGYRTVTFVDVGILLPKKEQIVFRGFSITEPIQTSYVLSEGLNVIVGTAAKEIANVLRAKGYSRYVRVIGFYKDTMGIVYKSKAFRFNVEEWL